MERLTIKMSITQKNYHVIYNLIFGYDMEKKERINISCPFQTFVSTWLTSPLGPTTSILPIEDLTRMSKHSTTPSSPPQATNT